MAKIFVTRNIPGGGIEKLKEAGHDVTVSEKEGVMTAEELKTTLSEGQYEGVLPLLTDKIDASVFDAAPSVKIFANYAVGFNNIDLEEAKKRGVTITNTPGDLTRPVAEHTFGLILALWKHLVEADKFVKGGKYQGWDPNLFVGVDLRGKTLGVLGAGHIGDTIMRIAKNGFDMNVIYYDVVQNTSAENELGAVFYKNPEDVFKNSDVVSVNVPLLDSTRHLVNAERLALMKKTAILINTSRGPVMDEKAVVEALKNKTIAGVGMDVYEDEPILAPGLADLDNVILTPHIASATEEARKSMSDLASGNLIAFFNGETPPNVVS
ncbi:D-glycerate dehydrogenase [Candidatus Wolfebacteria bacterium]|nr:MAG: D-glycerate dehydrogenase [Candidatus Wolfebacteria bacterium]